MSKVAKYLILLVISATLTACTSLSVPQRGALNIIVEQVVKQHKAEQKLNDN